MAYSTHESFPEEVRSKKFVLYIFFIIIIAFFVKLQSMFNFMTSIDDVGWISLAYLQTNAIDAATQVSRIFTYAPLQFFVGYPLYHSASEWSDLVWKARFISFLLAMMGIVLVYILFLRIAGLSKQISNLIVLPFVLLSLNFRGIIESSQAYNYASVIPCVALVSLYFGKLIQAGIKSKSNIGLFLVYLIFSSLVIWFSYQLITFVFASSVYVILNLCYQTLRKNFHRSGKYIHLSIKLILFLLILISFFFLYENFLNKNLEGSRTVTGWALQDIPNYDGLHSIHLALYLVSYLLNLFLKLFMYSFSFFLPYQVGDWVYAWGVIWMSISVLPIILGSPISERNLLFRHLLRLHLLFLSISVILNLFQKIPIGSTRHSYIYQVSLSLLILNGLYSLFAFLQKKGNKVKTEKFLIFANVFLVTLFLSQIPSFFRATQERYKLETLYNLAKKYGASYIIEDEATVNALIAYQLNLKPFDRVSGITVKQIPLSTIEQDQLKSPLLISSHVRVCDHCYQYLLGSKTISGKIEDLILLPPIGATEIVGNINGGNGLFVTLVR